MSARTLVDSGTLDQVGDLLESLTTLTKSYQIYGIDHPRTRNAVNRYYRRAANVAELPGIEEHVTVAYHGGRFFLEHVPLPVSRKQGFLFVAHLEASRMAGFQLSLGLGGDALEELLKLLSAQPSPRRSVVPRPLSGFRWLVQEEVERLESAGHGGGFSLHLILRLPELRVEDDVYLRTMNTLAAFMQQCTEVDDADLDPVRHASDELVDQFIDDADQLMPLTTIPYCDNFVYHHSLNVSLLTLKAARLVTDSPAYLRRIGQAALLHDLGKTDIPADILHKPGRLTQSEAKIVMEHPAIGARRLAATPNVDPLAVAVAFGHHIKDNGQGYPRVSSRYRIGPVTSLVEVADMFEALTAQRPYKKAVTAADAFGLLYSMPNMKSFRPYVDLLVRAIGLEPTGSRVRLADSEIGVVVGHEGENPRQPVVRPLLSERGGRYRLAAARACASVCDSSPSLGEDRVVALDPDEDFQRHA